MGIGFFFTGSVLMILYLAAHQICSTGFFTARFGALEMFMLYESWFSWIITSGLDGVLDRRFLSRLFDSFGGIIFIAVATAWLVIVFSFDFIYFADVLPDVLQFLLQWISNDIARVLMILYAIVMGIAALYAPIAYEFIRITRSIVTKKREV
jgi:type IV secretory pathway VirB2 component (pilin)